MSDVQQHVADQAPAGSPLEGIRQRVEAAKAKLHIDLAVPRLDPPIYVRYAPVSSARILKLQTQRTDSEDRVVEGNAVMLADAAQAIFEVKDGRRVSLDPSGEVLTFSPRLRELLGLPETAKAADIVRALYLADGDIVSTAEQLSDWSGYNQRVVALELEGN